MYKAYKCKNYKLISEDLKTSYEVDGQSREFVVFNETDIRIVESGFKCFDDAQKRANELNEQLSPKVKVVYKKVECDIYKLHELKDDLDNGLLFVNGFFSVNDGRVKIDTIEALIESVLANKPIYKRVETIIDIEDAICDVAYDNIQEVGVGCESIHETFHELSEVLRKYGWKVGGKGVV